MNLAMMFLAERCLQVRIVILSRSVVHLNTKDTWRDRHSQTLALLLPNIATRRPNWISVSHVLAVEGAVQRKVGQGWFDSGERPFIGNKFDASDLSSAPL